MNPDAPIPTPDRSAWVSRSLLAIALVFLLESAKPLMLPVVIAVAFTFVLAGPVRWLGLRGIPEFLGAGLVIAAVLAVMAMLFALLAAPASQWWERAPAAVQDLLQSAQKLRNVVLPSSQAPPQAGLPAPDEDTDRISEQLTTEGISMTRAALGNMLSFTVLASATVFLLFFLLASERFLIARTVEAIRRRRMRAVVLSGIRQAQRDIGLFIRTMVLISVGLGAATGVALALIGFPDPVLWATATAVLTFVPYIGPVLVTLALLVAGGMESGTGPAMLVPPALFLLLHFIESNFLSPLIMGHRLRINPVFVFLSVLFWSWLWGIAGAFVAVPLLLGLRAASQRSRRLRWVRIYIDADVADAASVRSLLHVSKPGGVARSHER